jgi:hypothetical protein
MSKRLPETSRVNRAQLESNERWREVEIPAISFPAGWMVQLVPPFAGAMARFVATNTHGVKVSVYYDVNDTLGFVGQPYWEVYPVEGDVLAAEDDNMRFLAAETEQMIQYIARLGDPLRSAANALGGGELVEALDAQGPVSRA